MNPGGSVKDRPAEKLIRDAEERGVLDPASGGTVVEGTAGNTGIGLAHICNSKGYRCVICESGPAPTRPAPCPEFHTPTCFLVGCVTQTPPSAGTPARPPSFAPRARVPVCHRGEKKKEKEGN